MPVLRAEDPRFQSSSIVREKAQDNQWESNQIHPVQHDKTRQGLGLMSDWTNRSPLGRTETKKAWSGQVLFLPFHLGRENTRAKRQGLGLMSDWTNRSPLGRTETKKAWSGQVLFLPFHLGRENTRAKAVGRTPHIPEQQPQCAQNSSTNQ